MAKKATRFLGCIRQSISNLSEMILLPYPELVRPEWKELWASQYKKRGHIGECPKKNHKDD